MTKEIFEKLWAARRRHLEPMLVAPREHHECDQCRSVQPKEVGICPVCKAYRFVEDPAVVASTLRLMLTSPFPVNVGVIPRI